MAATNDGEICSVNFQGVDESGPFLDGEDQAIPTNDEELSSLILKFRSECISLWEAT